MEPAVAPPITGGWKLIDAGVGSFCNLHIYALTIAVSLGGTAQQAHAQARAAENVVRQAEDAFGTNVGRESIGIYNSSNVRGFSPTTAGNARIDGLYFDQIVDVDS